MTNKLPVVGKIYKHQYCECCDIIVDSIQIEESGIWINRMDSQTLTSFDKIEIKSFWNSYKELPEDKAETECSVGKKSNCKKCGREFLQHHRSDYYCSNYCCYMPETETVRSVEMPTTGLSLEVKEAMEELKKILIKENDSMFFTVHQSEHTTEVLRLTCHAFSDKAKTLLNALDKQFKVNETSESVDIKEEEVNKISCGYNPLSDSKMIYLREEWGKNGEGFGAVLGKDMVGNLENKEEPNEKSEFELLMAGAEKIDKVDADIKKQTVDEFFSDYEKLKERVKKLEEK